MGGLIGGLARQLQQLADQGLVGGDVPAPAAAAPEPEAAPAAETEAAPAADTTSETETQED